MTDVVDAKDETKTTSQDAVAEVQDGGALEAVSKTGQDGREEHAPVIDALDPKSRETTPPPLPPQPIQETPTSVSSLRVSRASQRPKLQSKATTAVSLTDIHLVPGSDASPRASKSGSRATSTIRSPPHTGRFASRSGSDFDDSASTRSFSSNVPWDAGGEVESLLHNIQRRQKHVEVQELPAPDHDEPLFEYIQDEDAGFETMFKHEFTELEELDQDGSNEETLMIRWRSKIKHFIILSSAGKPIYSRHGDNQLISNTVGVIQTIISFYKNADDTLKSFIAGDARFAILSKGYLHLVAISRMGENDSELRAQLESLYMQILSTLTLPTMQRMFTNRPSTDLRRPLEGSETLLSALADGFTRGSPATLLSAIECLMLRSKHRDLINQALLKTRTPNLLYGLVVANGALTAVLRPKKHSLHPGDLRLIFNMLFEADGIRAGGGEAWIPICLPGFNNTGYLHMYVSFVSARAASEQAAGSKSANERPNSADGADADDVAIILISAARDAFYELRAMRDALVAQLAANGAMGHVHAAMRAGRVPCSDSVPGTSIRHYLYKSRANVQFCMPATEDAFTAPIDWRRLMTLYHALHAAVHGRGQVRIYHAVSRYHISLAWITPVFELYCVASVSTGRTVLAQNASRLAQWIQKEEQRLFIVGGAVF